MHSLIWKARGTLPLNIYLSVWARIEILRSGGFSSVSSSPVEVILLKG